MAEQPVPASMAAIAGLYQTENGFHDIATNQWELILGADPMRYYVRFWLRSAPGGFNLIPGPTGDVPCQAAQNLDGPLSFKWKDCPSMVAGEWYATDVIGNRIYWTAVRYLGG